MRKICYVLAVFICLSVTACAPLVFFGAGTAAGIAGLKFYKGSLTVIYESPFMAVWDGTLRALKEMNIRVLRSNHDITSGKITGKRADGKPVSISLKYKSAKETEAVIRVGRIGDEAGAMAIKEKIRIILFET